MNQRSTVDRICHALETSANPVTRNYVETSRLASVLEFLALELGGPDMNHYLSSAYRYRGIVAFELCRYDAALELFSRALERERSAVNLAHMKDVVAKLGDSMPNELPIEVVDVEKIVH
ncbi:MAG: hypothetical protein HN348_07520 [Proteobacteria bacterium]|jgi:hypothetical protein|nr:hypothetical protein [Pseudomonadota bacterium]